MLNLIDSIRRFYWKNIANPIKYARHSGVTIGNNCMIATRNFGTEPYLISIGNNVQITQGVYLHTHGGSHAARRQIPMFDVFGKIQINDNVYIGSCSHIMPGVTIGEGALVAAGSIVTKSVPPHVVVGGNPAKYICSVEEYINHNVKYNLGTKKLSSKEKKEVLMSLSDDKFIIKNYLHVNR